MTPERKAEIEALASRWETRPSRRGLAPILRELLADNARLEKRAKEQTIALTGLTCGGSEFFVREGEAFYADIDACVKYVRDRQSDQHREIVKRVGLQKTAEAKLAKAQEALKPIAERADEIDSIPALSRYASEGSANVPLTAIRSARTTLSEIEDR